MKRMHKIIFHFLLKTTFIFIELIMSIVIRVFLLSFLAFCLGMAAFGQPLPTTQLVKGQIFDQNRGAVVGAKITARQNVGSLLTTISDNSGEFSFALNPGEYIL